MSQQVVHVQKREIHREFYVIHVVHVLTINISSNRCTLLYTIYDI